MRANLIEMPVPNIVHQAPDDIRVSLDCFLLGPEVAAGEAREIFQIAKYFVVIGADHRHILGSSMHAFDNFFTPLQPIQEISK